MEGSLFGLDLDWEGEVDNMDWTAVADDEILSCIEDFSGEDILWASVAIEREGINLFDSKVLDFLLSNEDADLIEKSLAALFKAEEGKNVLNNDFEFTEDILGATRDFEEEINPLDEPTLSGDSTQWPPSTCSAPEEDPSTQHTTATFDEEKRSQALKKRRALQRKAGNSTDWRRGDKIQRKDLSFIETEETVVETPPPNTKMEIKEEQPEAPHQLPPAAIPTNGYVQEDDEEFFNVEDIVARRLKKRKRGESNVPTCPEDYYEYKVKWEGYGPEANTWEPYANVSHCNEHLDRLKEILEAKKQQQPLKKTKRATAGQRKSTTRNSLTSSGKSQVSDVNNNNLEQHFDRKDEEQRQQRKRKIVKREQLSEDEDGDELWVLPEAKRRNTCNRAVSSAPTRKIPKRGASSFRR